MRRLPPVSRPDRRWPGEPVAWAATARRELRNPPQAGKWKLENRRGKLAARGVLEGKMASLIYFPFSNFSFPSSENVTAQILVFHDVGKLLVDVRCVNLHGFLLQVGGLEGKFIQNFFENGMQAARADVFRLFVHAGGKARDGLHSILGKREFHTLGFKQRDVLLDERVLRLGENPDKVLFLQRLHFDADGQAALQLRNKV